MQLHALKQQQLTLQSHFAPIFKSQVKEETGMPIAPFEVALSAATRWLDSWMRCVTGIIHRNSQVYPLNGDSLKPRMCLQAYLWRNQVRDQLQKM